MSNAIAISRDLTAAGFTQKQADTVAEIVVTHTDETHSTKADIAELKGGIKTEIAELRGEIQSVATTAKINIGISIGILLYLLSQTTL